MTFPTFHFSKKSLSLVAIPIVIIASWLLWTKVLKTQSTTAQSDAATITVEKGTLVISVTSSGQIAASNSRSVSTNVSGVVKTVFVKNNEAVKSGQKLIELELDQESRQSYTQALAAYQTAQNSLVAARANLYTTQATMLNSWDNFKKLAESDTYKDPTSETRTLPEFYISQNGWLAAEALFKNQQSVVNQAQTSLNSASQSLSLSSPIIYAPISGTVSGLSLMPGNVITKDSSSGTSTELSIAAITTEAKPTVTINLSETDVTKVKIGNKVTITIDALPTKTYSGRVVSIDTLGSVSSGVTSYPAVVAFDTAAPEIFAHMSAQASIITETKDNVLVVPTSSVQTQNGISSVAIIKDGQVQSVNIETGLSSGTQVEVVAGLTGGEQILSSNRPTSAATTKNSTQTTSPFSGLSGPGALGGGTVRVNR